MPTDKAFLLDFEQEHVLTEQLLQVLRDSAKPRFEIRCQRVAEAASSSTSKTLHLQAAAFSPDLTFLAFDHVPRSDFVGPLLETLRNGGGTPATIVVAPTPSADEIIELFHAGATDVWPTPLRAPEVLARASHWVETLRKERPEPPKRLDGRLGLEDFVGESPVLMAELRKIPVIARYDVSVLIRGETGTGKEVCARAIHILSERGGKPFVPINCGALPVELVENELFGHGSGAFTSANGPAAGLIQQADGGTLFLDEIDALPFSAQVKLLRFLQDKQYRPLGSQKVRTADLRVLAATNANLEQSVRAGLFRQDLLYRLNIVEVTLPPLRERGDDVELLARHFLKKCAAKLRKPAHGFATEAARKLRCYSWPGNVRELENVVERAVVFSEQNIIRGEEIMLPGVERDGSGATFKELKAQAIRTFEKNYLSELLRAHHGEITKAACAAKKERRTFWALLRKHGLTGTVARQQAG